MQKVILIVLAFLILQAECKAQSFNSDSANGYVAATLVNDPGKTGLKLPQGFKGTIVADNLGKSRHIAVTKQGNVYVKLDRPSDKGGVLYLEDKNKDGKADKISGFGDYGGTGISIKDNYLYASSNKEVFRYILNDKGEVTNQKSPEKIVKGLVARRQHESKSITLDNNGNIYVNIGAPSNACQEKDRVNGSQGIKPCPILDSAGGIWQFKSDKTDQSYAEGVRYATGLRNVVGLDWNNQNNQLYVMQHGRDQLFQLYPNLYSEKQSAELPAETMYAINKGDDAGWPYVYYDQFQSKKKLHLNMVEMERKQVVKMQLIPSSYFRHIWLLMDFCFILEISFLPNIKTEHL